MPTTRLEARTRARMFIGEPYASGVTSLDGTYLDAEINTALASAQERVCIDAQHPSGLSLVPKESRLRAVSGKRIYELPADCVKVNRVVVMSSGVQQEIPEIPLMELIDQYDEVSTASLPNGWQLYPRSRFIITEGIATSGSATTVVDADRNADATYGFAAGTAVKDDEGGALAAGDVVVNVTDGSEAAISAVTSSTTLTFAAQSEDGGLAGGTRNNFELGDEYQVVGVERTRRSLYVAYPLGANDDDVFESHTTDTNTAEVAVGTDSSAQNTKQAQGFILDRDTVISAVALYFGATTGTPLGSAVVRIETNSAGVPSDTLADIRAKAALETPSASGWNIFTFASPFRLAANTVYHIVVAIPAQSGYYAAPSSNYFTVVGDTDSGYTDAAASVWTGSWAAASRDLLFKVYAAENNESIRVFYTSSGRIPSGDTDVYDIPSEAEDAFFTYAEYLLTSKVNRDKAAEKLSIYKMLVEELKLILYRNSRNAYGYVRDFTYPVSRRTLNYVTPVVVP